MAKTLLITLAFPPDIGGMQSFAYQRCLQAGTNHLVVLAPRTKGWQAFDRRQPVRICRWSAALQNVPGIRRVLQFVLPLLHGLRLHRQNRFDVIECWQPLPFGLIGLVFKVLHDIPYVVWSHGNDLSRPQRYPLAKLFLSQVLASANLVIANSQGTKGELLALGTRPDKIRVLNPPVDTQRFKPNIDPSAIVQKHGLEGKRVILTVARLVQVKGIDTVIRALPKVIEAIPDTVYLVAGDGPLRAKLDYLAETLGVRDNVIFAGAVDYLSDDLPRYYTACDVFVLVSRPLPQRKEVERFGMAYLEAGACGKPVIGGRGGGTSEAIKDGVTGLLIDPLDVNKIADTLVGVLEDKDLARRLGENGRKRAEKQPDWNLVFETCSYHLN
jgi:phosphatidylinositol alpha-1,6-mannosyltransferase